MRSTQAPVMYGTCPTCGYLMLPVPPLSPCGHPDEPIVRPMEAEGTVYSWTRSWSSPEQSTLIAMADFFDGLLRVTAPLTGTEHVTIGDTVDVQSGETTPFALRHVAS